MDLVPLGIYELVTGHPPLPIASLLQKLASEHSRRTYRQAIDRYLWLIERDHFGADLAGVNTHIAELAMYRPPVIVALHLRIIRELYQEAVEQGLLAKNVAASVPSPAYTPDPSCVPPSRDEAAKRQADFNLNTEAGRRDYALCLLALETSIEPNAVPALTIRDYVIKEGEAFLLANDPSGTAQEVKLAQNLREALDKYLNGREVADDSPLFGVPRFRNRPTPHCLKLISNAAKAGLC